MATNKLAYASAVQLTITLAGLASDTNLLIGRQSTVVDNSSNLYQDYLLSGKITANGVSAPTAGKQIEVWAFAQRSDAPAYPDVLGSTDAAATISDANVKGAALRQVAILTTNATTGQAYEFAAVSVASLFGGVCPQRWGVFVVQNSGQALNATAGNFAIFQQGVYSTTV